MYVHRYFFNSHSYLFITIIYNCNLVHISIILKLFLIKYDKYNLLDNYICIIILLQEITYNFNIVDILVWVIINHI